MKKKNSNYKAQSVGILGKGEIGQAIARLCEEAGFSVMTRELDYDQLSGKTVDILHVNVPEKNNKTFLEIVVRNIKELKPKLTIINSTITPGTTKKIQQLTKSLVVHSPIIGIHPHIYESIKSFFPKIIGATSKQSLLEAKRHFKDLGLKTMVYKSSDESEAAKLLDLVYYAWNIIFCKWVDEVCEKSGLNFDDVYTKHNNTYNSGYKKIFPRVIRPVLIPTKGPIGGHCTIPDVEIFHKHFKNRFTKFIIEENKRLDEISPANYLDKKLSQEKSKLIKKSNLF